MPGYDRAHPAVRALVETPAGELAARRAQLQAAAADDVVGDVIVFADDGFLSSLEIVWYLEPISPFPPADRLQLWSHDS